LLETLNVVWLVNIRQIEEEDYEAFKRLFEEAHSEYLEVLKNENPQQYLEERHERKDVTRARFDFYLKTGSSFIAEEDGKVVGYVASQMVNFMHGVDKMLWIEYVVVQHKLRRKGIGYALLKRLIDYAKNSGADQIYATINPDNEASVALHLKAGSNVKDWKIASYKTSK